MAKKKTENIKAAPVLRAGSGGEQPAPTPEQTGTRTYQIMDPWKDRDKVNLVDVKSVDGEITDVKVNGEPAGGGGGGGATVVFTNSSNSKEFDLKMPIIDLESGIVRVDDIQLSAGETKTVTVSLGPGGCFVNIGGKGDWPENGTATGGVRYDDGNIYVTGNGTLTLS